MYHRNHFQVALSRFTLLCNPRPIHLHSFILILRTKTLRSSNSPSRSPSPPFWSALPTAPPPVCLNLATLSGITQYLFCFVFLQLPYFPQQKSPSNRHPMIYRRTAWRAAASHRSSLGNIPPHTTNRNRLGREEAQHRLLLEDGGNGTSSPSQQGAGLALTLGGGGPQSPSSLQSYPEHSPSGPAAETTNTLSCEMPLFSCQAQVSSHTADIFLKKLLNPRMAPAS